MRTYVFQTQQPQTTTSSSTLYISTVTTAHDLETFYSIPRIIYHNDPRWVLPFWTDISEFFQTSNYFWTHAETQLYIAYHHDNPVGRIAAIIDHNLTDPSTKKIGYFGFFECIDNSDIALQLLAHAEHWLKTKGITQLRGPINGHIDLGCGMLYEGFDQQPSLISQYTPRYYPTFMDNYNMKKLKDLVSYKIDLSVPIPKIAQETAQRCTQQGIQVRPFNRYHFTKETKRWYSLFQPLFANHWGYASSSYKEMMHRIGLKQLRWIMNPRLFLFAEKNNEIIGFRIALPEYSPLFRTFQGKLGFPQKIQFLRKKNALTHGKFIVMGIKKEYQGNGIGTCLNYHTLVEMKKLGFTSAEYGWIEEDNISSRKAGEKIGGFLYKRHRIYYKNI
jgi:hypothetical protein